MTSPVSPVYFPVSGDWNAITDPSLSGSATTPVVQPISALCTFVPRVPKGFVAYIKDFAISSNVSAVQVLTILGAVNGGTWKGNFEGQWVASPIPYNETAPNVQAAFTALSTIGSGNLAVTGNPGGPWTFNFQGALANKPVSTIQLDYSALLAASGTVSMTAEQPTPGSSARSGPSALAIPTRQGRIWNGVLSSIDVADTPGVQLLANMPELNLASLDLAELIYDVMFTQVTYAAAPQDLSNFAFAAPADATPICITDPDLPRMPWQTPPS